MVHESTRKALEAALEVIAKPEFASGRVILNRNIGDALACLAERYTYETEVSCYPTWRGYLSPVDYIRGAIRELAEVEEDWFKWDAVHLEPDARNNILNAMTILLAALMHCGPLRTMEEQDREVSAGGL